MSVSPVIIVCYGWHEGLPSMLESLKVYSPDTPVHVIGNQVTRQHIQCESVELYGESASKFCCHYEHHSTNNQKFELQCFLRWFVAYEFMRAKEIKSAYLLDWDVLVLCNLNDYTQENTIPIGAMCQMDLECLTDWCEFMFATYRDKSKLNVFIDKIKSGGLKWPIISDMSLGDWWGYDQKLINPFSLDDSNEAFDLNIASDDYGFVIESGHKRLRFENGYALAYNGKTESWKRMLTLHCWNGYKSVMSEFLKKAIESK